jgi:hypothetical protein
LNYDFGLSNYVRNKDRWKIPAVLANANAIVNSTMLITARDIIAAGIEKE